MQIRRSVVFLGPIRRSDLIFVQIRIRVTLKMFRGIQKVALYHEKINYLIQLFCNRNRCGTSCLRSFRYSLKTFSIRDRAYVSSNNTDLTDQQSTSLQNESIWYCVKYFSINLLTDITLDILLVEPQNSEEAELNFMVICLPVSIFPLFILEVLKP